MILYIMLLWLELLATELSSDMDTDFQKFFGGILAKAIYIASCHAIMLLGQINNVMTYA